MTLESGDCGAKRGETPVAQTIGQCLDGSPTAEEMQNVRDQRVCADAPAGRVVLENELAVLPVGNQLWRASKARRPAALGAFTASSALDTSDASEVDAVCRILLMKRRTALEAAAASS